MQNAVKKITFTYTEGERRICRIPEKISTANWAEKHRVVVDGGRKSPWDNRRSPCAVGVMDALDAPFIREIYVQAPPQSIKTQPYINWLMKCIDVDPGPAMLAMPDEKLLRRIFRRRLTTSIKATPRVAELLSNVMGDVTRTSIAFVNGMDITGAWAGSPASLASDAMEKVILDEVNKYPDPTADEPNAFDMARQRTNSFPFTYKIYVCSTPTGEKGLISEVIKKRADVVYYYYVKCPICGEEQRMVWENITWGETRDARKVAREKLARYNCRRCAFQWDDDMRDKAVLATMHNGWRVAEDAEPVARPRAVAFKLSSWYVKSMSEAVANFLHGQEDPERLKTWVTQDVAEAWLEKAVRKSEHEVLARKSIYPAMIVPPEAIALTAGVDVQKYGFYFVVRAWAEDLTSWLIHYGYITTFSDVEKLIYDSEYKIHDSKQTMKIWRAGIDIGGGAGDEGEWSRTEEIEQWLRKQPMGAAQRIYGTKGSSHTRDQKRIKVSRLDTFPSSSKPIPGGLELRLLDTSQYKGLILHFRLGRKEQTETTEAESQRFYIHADTEIDYVKQLLSEEWRAGKNKQMMWKKIYFKNHYLDCFDPETEILTKDGWVAVYEVNQYHECATVNLQNNQIEYQCPTRLIAREHKGDMVHIKGRRIDILTTPNHRMIVYKKTFHWRDGKHRYKTEPEIVLAKDITIWDKLKCTAQWEGIKRDYIIMPESRRQDGYLLEHERKIEASAWAEFLGWYVSEGHRFIPKCNKSHSYRIVISQSAGEKQDRIKKLLNSLPWKWRIDQGRQFVISSKQLYFMLKDIGCGAHHKNVSRWIKDSDPETIKIFLSAAIAGDGWIQNKFRSYATTSKQLADEIQELFIKTGTASNIKIRKAKPIKLRGSLSNNTVDQYHVTECRTKNISMRDGKNKPIFKIVQYEGNVYCVSVPNGTLICRRNGRSFIAGNCEVIAAACADPEWLPSLQMLAPYFKNRRNDQAPPPQGRRVVSKGVDMYGG